MGLLTQFCEEKGLADGTQKHYISSVKLYEQINNDTLDNLIVEADNEEEAGIRWKNRKIKQRLLNYRSILYANNYGADTVTLYVNDIKTIYRYFGLELQPLPRHTSKQINKTYEMTYEDLPSKQELIDAFHEGNNVVKCVILFAISSGYSKVDFLNLTVKDFLDACDEYITCKGEITDKLEELKSQQEVIPCFTGNRQKTGKKFITFCSPEATEYIVQYLLGRDATLRQDYFDTGESPDGLKESDPLFNISGSHLSYAFRRINQKLHLGKAGNSTRLRCHMFRKYQATTLSNFKDVSWTVEEIDILQGRSQDKTHRAYFHNDAEKLREKYYESVDELMLFKSIHEIDKEEFEKIEKENRFYKKEIIKNETKLEAQQDTIDKILENQRELESLLGLQKEG